MRTIETSITASADRVTTFDEPPQLPVGRHRVIVLVDEPTRTARDERGWPPGFPEDTYGSFADEPPCRPEQDVSQDREPLG